MNAFSHPHKSAMDLSRRSKGNRVSLLLATEAVAVLLFTVLVLWRVLVPVDDGSLAPIDVAALSTGPASETWMSIYFEDQPVGFSVSSEVPMADGGLLIQGRSLFRMVNMGELQRVVTAGSALLLGKQLEQTHCLLERSLAGKAGEAYRLQKVADILVVPHRRLNPVGNGFLPVLSVAAAERQAPLTIRVRSWQGLLNSGPDQVPIH